LLEINSTEKWQPLKKCFGHTNVDGSRNADVDGTILVAPTRRRERLTDLETADQLGAAAVGFSGHIPR
jgi:hypothetical protein